MNERERLIESYVREILLSELTLKTPFKKKIARSWENLKRKFADYLGDLGVDRSRRRKSFFNAEETERDSYDWDSQARSKIQIGRAHV